MRCVEKKKVVGEAKRRKEKNESNGICQCAQRYLYEDDGERLGPLRRVMVRRIVLPLGRDRGWG